MTSTNYKYFLIYKTTNLIDNKIYIGQHKTNDLNDGYLGSGSILKLAISKHGRENFKQEILKFCSNDEELCNEELKAIELFGSSNKEIGYNILNYNHVYTPNWGKGTSPKSKEGLKNIEAANKDLDKRMQISKTLKGHIVSEETKNKIRESLKSSFIKKYWCHHPLTKKRMKLPLNEDMPVGWVKGTGIVPTPASNIIRSKKIKKMWEDGKISNDDRIFSAETRKKISEANKGRIVSAETRKKIGEKNKISQIGKRHSEETKAKMRASHALRNL